MFNNKGKKSTFGNVIKSSADKVANFCSDLEDGKTLGEKIEKAVSKLINADPDVQFILKSIISDLDYPGELTIIPKVNDDTLLVEAYVLTTNGEPVISAKDAKTLVKNLREIVLTEDDTKIKAFIKSLQTAYDKASK